MNLKTKQNFFISVIIQSKQLLQCGEQSLSSWFSSVGPSIKTKVQAMRLSAKPNENDSKIKKNLRLILHQMIALADRVGAVQNSKAVAKAFPRFIVGLVCILWLAPYADVFYTRLDVNDKVSAEVWYYQSFNWLFLCLGPYLKNLFTVIGLYLCLVPKRNLILSLLIAYSLMYDVGKIIWLLQVSNHDEYNSVPTTLFNTYGFITSLFAIILIDLLSFWLFHRVHAIKARLQGLRNIADKADASVIVKEFVVTMDAGLKVEQFKS